MCERTVTIPLEEYEQLKENKEYRYQGKNGRTYIWNSVPEAKEIEEIIRKDYQEELEFWKDYHNKASNAVDKWFKELYKIPKWVRRLYGAE